MKKTTFFSFEYREDIESSGNIKPVTHKKTIGPHLEHKHIVLGAITIEEKDSFDRITVELPVGKGTIRKKAKHYSIATVLEELAIYVVMQDRLKDF